MVKKWEAANAEPWDACRSGSSALDAAYMRALIAEIAMRTGRHCAVILWDFAKFFDSVFLGLVVDGARSLHFPITDLVLGLHMHLADRRLQHSGCVAALITPFRSLLAGCGLAIAFTKALL